MSDTASTPLLLYGSQTGVARGLAEDLVVDLSNLSPPVSVRLMCMENFKQFDVTKEKVVIMVCSTTGDGDPPDNASRFWRQIKKRTLAPDHLAGLNFTVLGLGDTNYTNFCNCGKQFYERFLALGAQCFYPPGWADDATGLEIVVEPWREGLPAALKKVLNEVDSSPSPALKKEVKPKKKIVPKLAAEFLTVAYGDLLTTPSFTPADFALAPLKRYRRLTADGAVRRTLEVTVDISNSSILYSAGDTFAIACPNNPAEVDALLERVGAVEDADKALQLSILPSAPKTKSTVPAHLKTATTLRSALLCCCDLRSPIRKALLRCFAEHATDDNEKAEMLRLCGSDASGDFNTLTRQKHVGVLALLSVFPSCQPPVSRLLELLPAICPRYYSVTSAPEETPTEASFAFNIVENSASPDENVCRPGLCTNWLDSLCKSFCNENEKALQNYRNPSCPETSRSPGSVNNSDPTTITQKFESMDLNENGETNKESNGHCNANESQSMIDKTQSDGNSCCNVFQCLFENRSPVCEDAILAIQHRPALHFKPPSNLQRPLILIGPGTGIAPFLSFLRQRRALCAQHPDIKAGRCLVFSGCRNRDLDFLYGQELTELQQQGIITDLHVATSRQGDTPTYAQHYLKEQGKLVTRLLLEEEGSFLMCGGVAMAKDIHEMLIQILKEHGPQDVDAESIIKTWTEEKRYVREIWG
eukprot:m.25560 g.25560  ORF g.25560 m.25560 type:complete len:701 (+) comp13581_c0_seq1:109-2211(+)